MPILNISFPHHLPKEEAVFRMKRLLDDLRIRHAGELEDGAERWEANTARFELLVKGVRVRGTIKVLEREALMALEYPPEAAPHIDAVETQFRNMAETIMR